MCRRRWRASTSPSVEPGVTVVVSIYGAVDGSLPDATPSPCADAVPVSRRDRLPNSSLRVVLFHKLETLCGPRWTAVGRLVTSDHAGLPRRLAQDERTGPAGWRDVEHVARRCWGAGTRRASVTRGRARASDGSGGGDVQLERNGPERADEAVELIGSPGGGRRAMTRSRPVRTRRRRA